MQHEIFGIKEDPETIEVGQESWDLAHKPERIMTENISHCGGVVVQNLRQNMILLGHFAQPPRSRSFESLLREASDKMGDPKEWKVFLVGVGLSDKTQEAIDEAKEIREQLIGVFKEIGVRDEQMTIRWNDSEEVADIYADTETGEVYIDVKDLATTIKGYDRGSDVDSDY